MCAIGAHFQLLTWVLTAIATNVTVYDSGFPSLVTCIMAFRIRFFIINFRVTEKAFFRHIIESSIDAGRHGTNVFTVNLWFGTV